MNSGEIQALIADYLIGEIRRASGLTFEVNEKLHDFHYIDEAFLTDGESWLSVWVTHENAFAEFHVDVTIAEYEFCVQGEMTHDSSKRFASSEFHEWIGRGVDLMQKTLINECKRYVTQVSQISFEAIAIGKPLNLAPWHLALKEAFGESVKFLPKRVENGAENVTVESDEQENHRWSQVTFNSPLSVSKIANRLSPYLTNVHLMQSGTNKSFQTTEPLRSSTGVDKIRMLTRRF